MEVLSRLALLWVLGVAAQAQVPLTLKECVDRALEKNPDIRLSHVDTVLARKELERAKLAFVPRLNLEMYRDERVFPSLFATDVSGNASLISQDTNRYEAGLSGNLPTATQWYAEFRTTRLSTTSSNLLIPTYYDSLFTLGGRQELLRGVDWFHTFLGADGVRVLLAQQEAKRSRVALERSVAESIHRVEVAYVQLAGALEQIKAYQAALDLATQQLEVTQKKIAAGLLVEADAYQVMEQVESRRADLLTAQQEAIRLKRELVFLAGLEDPSAQSTDAYILNLDAPASSAPDLQSVEAQVREQNWELRDAVMQTHIRQRDMRAKQSGVLPSLSLEGSYFLLGGNTPNDQGFSANIDELFRTRTDGWNLGILLEVPLGKSVHHKDYELSRLAYRRAQAETQRTQDSVLRETVPLVDTLTRGRGILKTLQERVGLAEKKVAFEEKKFSRGLTTNFNLLVYQQDLMLSRIRMIQTMVLLRSAQSRLDYLTGNTLKTYDLKVQPAT